jgi:hypothetical protein
MDLSGVTGKKREDPPGTPLLFDEAQLLDNFDDDMEFLCIQTNKCDRFHN